MFRLTTEEAAALRSQIVTLEKGRGRYSKYAPYAFTEQGVAMPSAVLKSKRAVQTSITIVRVFIKLREPLTTNKELAHKTGELQRTQKEHAAHITTIYKWSSRSWHLRRFRPATNWLLYRLEANSPRRFAS